LVVSSGRIANAGTASATTSTYGVKLLGYKKNIVQKMHRQATVVAAVAVRPSAAVASTTNPYFPAATWARKGDFLQLLRLLSQISLHSFQLIFGRVITSLQVHEVWMLF
jgi:hypothetical protein